MGKTEKKKKKTKTEQTVKEIIHKEMYRIKNTHYI